MQNINLSIYPFYDKLDTDSILLLKDNLQAIHIQKDNILFYQDDICDSILFLTKGTVRLYIQSDGTEEITLYQLNAGEQCIVNTASTMSQTKAIATAICSTDIEGYLLDVSHVKELAHISDAYQSFLFSIYTLRMASLAKLVNDLRFKHLDERILEWLQAQKNTIIKTTHEQIANELGTTRVVVSRVLKELEKNAKLTLTRGYIELL
ncbi:MAG: Crp/Fnr family transcriptional regulator [Sulfurimonas sp.]|nr:Crp/Fnr family transcriptional regulator [Sulfurimonas sp.]